MGQMESKDSTQSQEEKQRIAKQNLREDLEEEIKYETNRYKRREIQKKKSNKPLYRFYL